MAELLAVDGPLKGRKLEFGNAPRPGDWSTITLPLHASGQAGIECIRYDAVMAGPVLVCRQSGRPVTHYAESVDERHTPEARVERFMAAIRSGQLSIEDGVLKFDGSTEFVGHTLWK